MTPHAYEFALYFDARDAAGLPGEFGWFIQPRQLARLCHRADPGDPPVRHDKAARAIQFADDLPKTGTGKTKRRKVRTLVRGATGGPV